MRWNAIERAARIRRHRLRLAIVDQDGLKDVCRMSAPNQRTPS
jgi:hypothetical protein